MCVLVVTELFELEVGPRWPIPMDTEPRIGAHELTLDVFSISGHAMVVVVIVWDVLRIIRSSVVPAAIREKVWEEESLHVWISEAYGKAGVTIVLDEAGH